MARVLRFDRRGTLGSRDRRGSLGLRVGSVACGKQVAEALLQALLPRFLGIHLPLQFLRKIGNEKKQRRQLAEWQWNCAPLDPEQRQRNGVPP